LFIRAGDIQQKTEWHRIAVFKPYLRDTVYRYSEKGQRVLVQGRIVYGEITDAQGAQRPTTTIIAEDVIFLSKVAEGSAAEPAKTANLMDAR
jgi:single-strand DNA-binding protein